VVAAHAPGGGLQRLALLGGQAVEGGGQLVGLELQRAHAGRAHAVEAGGVFQHRRAARAHVGQDVGHALLDGRVLLGAPAGAAGIWLEIGLGG
jgi:hypothetical protein